MKEIYLISCTKKKQNYTCKAEEMYMMSPLFRASLNYALSMGINKSEIYILSAKYYLIPLDKIISPYDKTLNKMNKNEIDEWGLKVTEQIKNTFDLKNTTFIILAGNNSIKPIVKYLPMCNIINPVPCEFRSIGQRIKWLRENEKVTGYTVRAIDFRDKEKLKKCPNDKPGYYKWWALDRDVLELLNSKFIDKNHYNELINHMTKKKI